MAYLWQDFNIKTFPAETIVFLNGVYSADLSTLPESLKIDKKYDLPVHIIYLGDISGKNELNIDISAPDQNVIFTGKINVKKDVKSDSIFPAFLTIFIKNTGKNSEFAGKILITNEGLLEFGVFGEHLNENTGIFIETRVIGLNNSNTKLSGLAKIGQNIKDPKSDIKFSAILEKNAKIQFSPAQNISSVPKSADHSANLYKFSPAQIEYLRTAGLSALEIKNVLKESFSFI